MTLAIGVGVIAALQKLGIDGISLKWPNDIVAHDGKVGGILTEVQSGSGAGATVVTGIGLNVKIEQRIDFGAESEWAHKAVDLASVKADLPPREIIVGALIDSLYVTMRQFAESGLAPFMEEWRQHDWLRGRQIVVDMPDKQVAGAAAGVGDDGTLLVDTAAGQVRVLSGSIVMAEAGDQQH